MSKILLVDDDKISRLLLGGALKRAGHEVRDCADGLAALRACIDGRFDILITDIHMPEMDGLELIVALRRSGSSIRILAISGGSNQGHSYLEKANKIGADRILSKPLNLGNFIHVVDELASQDCLTAM